MAKTIRTEGHLALCKALLDARQARGLTQSELAKMLQCHQSFVARMESGERRIDVVELVVLARALDAEISAILAAVERATTSDHRI